MDSNPQSERAALRTIERTAGMCIDSYPVDMNRALEKCFSTARAALAIEPAPEPRCVACGGSGFREDVKIPGAIKPCNRCGGVGVAAPEPQITVNPDRQQGLPCVGGTRIPVHLVVWAEAHGSALESYPDLSPQQIKECLLYASECVRWKIARAAPTPAAFSTADDNKLAAIAMVTLLRAKSTDEQWASYGPEYDRHLQDALAVLTAADALRKEVIECQVELLRCALSGMPCECASDGPCARCIALDATQGANRISRRCSIGFKEALDAYRTARSNGEGL